MIDHDINQIDSNQSHRNQNCFTSTNIKQHKNITPIMTNSSVNNNSKDISFNNYMQFTDEQELSSIDNSYGQKQSHEHSTYIKLNSSNKENAR